MSSDKAPASQPLRTLSFMHLPHKVRRQIYIFAGLVRVCPIDLNDEGRNKRDYLRECADWCEGSLGDGRENFNNRAAHVCFYRSMKLAGSIFHYYNSDGFDCICEPRLPTQLLFISHAIHDEVSSILYSENKFRICRSNYRGLSALQNLTSQALASLTSLSIRLNKCSCVADHQCDNPWDRCRSCHAACKRGDDEPISKSTANGKAILQDWNLLADRIATNIQPSRLKLSLICDTINSDTAKDTVEPLIKMPTLAECAIRLGQAPNLELRRLAETTVFRVVDRPVDHLNSPFRFLDLPEEIQIQILEYTDLVAPFNLHWNPYTGLSRSDCCARCMDTLESCCCPPQHAAFSSMGCDCWRIPSELFQVSHKMRNYATQIFYSKNQFIFQIETYESVGICNSGGLSQFLRLLPPDALPHLRSIRCLFGPFNRDAFRPGDVALVTWEDAMEFIARNLSLPKLTLTLDQSLSRDDSYKVGGQESIEEENAVWACYQRMIEPMRQLHGLQNLYVHISSPYDERKIGLRDQRERILEKLVVGQEYDSFAAGKFSDEDYSHCEPETMKPVFGPDGSQIWPLRWN
ncbi:hypothetical protein MMC24_006999 [Lignoscripta atroalba]|nr:hypothetical protein [Lignoscripta atroalba]